MGREQLLMYIQIYVTPCTYSCIDLLLKGTENIEYLLNNIVLHMLLIFTWKYTYLTKLNAQQNQTR